MECQIRELLFSMKGTGVEGSFNVILNLCSPIQGTGIALLAPIYHEKECPLWTSFLQYEMVFLAQHFPSEVLVAISNPFRPPPLRK